MQNQLNKVEATYIENSVISETEFNIIASVLTSYNFHNYQTQIDFFDAVLSQLQLPATYSIHYSDVHQARCIKICLVSDVQFIGSVLTICNLAGE
jgi:hypothetical protein